MAGDTGWLTADVGESKWFTSEDDYDHYGEREWTNPSSARIDDTSYATGWLYEVGAYADAEVRLQYLETDSYGYAVGLPSRSDNRANVGVAWPDSFATATYGGSADLWGFADLDAVVELPEFGVILRPGPEAGQSWGSEHAYLSIRDYDVSIPVNQVVTGVEVRVVRRKSYYYDGSSSPSNYGYVDAVEMKVHYDQRPATTFNEVSTAPAKVGGSSTVTLGSAGPSTLHSGWLTADVGESRFYDSRDDSDQFGEREWTNPSSARLDDTSYASGYLYEVGAYSDAEVRLQYQDFDSYGYALGLPARSDNRGDVGTAWPDAFESPTYGGPTDTWGYSNLDAVVELPEFGVVLRPGPPSGGSWGSTHAYLSIRDFDVVVPAGKTVKGVEVRVTRRKSYYYDGESSPSNYGYVDAVELRAHWGIPATEYDETSTASALAGVASDHDLIRNLDSAASALIGGTALVDVRTPQVYSLTSTAGVRAGGTAGPSVVGSPTSTASVLAGGSAAVTVHGLDELTSTAAVLVGGEALVESYSVHPLTSAAGTRAGGTSAVSLVSSLQTAAQAAAGGSADVTVVASVESAAGLVAAPHARALIFDPSAASLVASPASAATLVFAAPAAASAIVGGSADVGVGYAAEAVTAAVRAGGSARVELVRPPKLTVGRVTLSLPFGSSVRLDV